MAEPTLPDTLSELTRIALRDLEAAEANPRYRVGMSMWHTPLTETGGMATGPEKPHHCRVCLAGAVMAGTLNAPFGEFIGPTDLVPDERGKLYALDSVRCGFLAEALSEFYWTDSGTDPELDHAVLERLINDPRLDFPDYEDDPAAFKAGLTRVADALEKEGF